ncbi:hypothetical protein EJ06DRAFT_339763 [Trichodelitschia bisporula]|uniref:Uncharacterized protein n=1 Tax=Trichodelitschia bisporula TaxID=703511 RepID=A0A6G1I300_9PEZI|nr:hypothetical protein EJ06DRAFT_339763 [Trichodelitschia bisporula]
MFPPEAPSDTQINEPCFPNITSPLHPRAAETVKCPSQQKGGIQIECEVACAHQAACPHHTLSPHTSMPCARL